MKKNIIKTVLIAFILMCVWVFLIVVPQWAVASIMDTEGEGEPCGFTCAVTAVHVVESSNIQYRYEFDGVCNFGGTGEYACPSPLQVRGKGTYYPGGKIANEVLEQKVHGGWAPLATSNSTCTVDPWTNAVPCTSSMVQTTYPAIRPSPANPVQYPRSADLLTPGQRSQLLAQVGQMYTERPLAPEVAISPETSPCYVGDKVFVTIKPKNMPSLGIQTKTRFQPISTLVEGWQDTDVIIEGKSIAQNGTLTGYFRPAKQGNWHVEAAMNAPQALKGTSAMVRAFKRPPLPPTGLKAVQPEGTTDRIQLSWHSNTFGAQYRIERKRTNGGTYATIATVNNTLGYLDTGLEPSHTYTYRVYLKINGEESPPSNESWSSTFPPAIHIDGGTTPKVPRNLTATGGLHSITLRWQVDLHESGNRPQAYIVERKGPGGAFAQIAQFPNTAAPLAGSGSYTDAAGLQPNTLYTYRVKSIYKQTQSPFSNEASAKTLSVSTAKPLPKAGL